MISLPAAIASLTAAGALAGAAASPLGRIVACWPAVSGSGPVYATPHASVGAAPPAVAGGELAEGRGGPGCGRELDVDGVL